MLRLICDGFLGAAQFNNTRIQLMDNKISVHEILSLKCTNYALGGIHQAYQITYDAVIDDDAIIDKSGIAVFLETESPAEFAKGLILYATSFNGDPIGSKITKEEMEEIVEKTKLIKDANIWIHSYDKVNVLDFERSCIRLFRKTALKNILLVVKSIDSELLDSIAEIDHSLRIKSKIFLSD